MGIEGVEKSTVSLCTKESTVSVLKRRGGGGHPRKKGAAEKRTRGRDKGRTSRGKNVLNMKQIKGWGCEKKRGQGVQ